MSNVKEFLTMHFLAHWDLLLVLIGQLYFWKSNCHKKEVR